jgi:hypothetical protein
LINNVSPAIHSGSAGHFAPDDKDQCNVVDPAINAVEQIISELGAIWQAPIKISTIDCSRPTEAKKGENPAWWKGRELVLLTSRMTAP